MSSRRRCPVNPRLSGRVAGMSGMMMMCAMMALLPFPLVCHAIHLDIYVPLPDGCTNYYALLANRLLRESSRPAAPSEEAMPQRPSERVDLFSRHTPHLTLYLADFDLEVDAPEDDNSDHAARALNTTKVQGFLGNISALNFTEIVAGWKCPLSFSKDPVTSSYFNLEGDYVMLPVENTPCLQTLSTTLLRSLQSFARQPVVVPSWVASLPEPRRSAAIFRSRTYGSPNVLEGFAPHVTVGFDPTGDAPAPARHAAVRSGLTRMTTMEQWNAAYQPVHETCSDEVRGVAVGKTGEGGTVLARSSLGHWDLKLAGHTEEGGDAPRNIDDNDGYEIVE